MENNELINIIKKFAESSWDTIAMPSKAWLAETNSDELKNKLIAATEQGYRECGDCGCDLDTLYKRALKLLK